MLRRLLREPLLHFFALGALIFLVFGWFNRDELRAPDEVVVDQAQVDGLTMQFQRLWQRPPTAEETRGLVDRWVREEILYREGLALGLDQNDTVVRRRIAQKMDFIAGGATPPVPTDAELSAWLEAHRSTYRIEATYTLRQAYFDAARHGEGLPRRLEGMARSLGDSAAAPEGDVTALPLTLSAASAGDVARTFGKEFSEALAGLPAGRWQGPIASSYGLHLVRIDELTPAHDPGLDEVRAAVVRDWSAAKSDELNEEFYESVRARYTVRIDPAIAGTAGGTAPGAR